MTYFTLFGFAPATGHVFVILNSAPSATVLMLDGCSAQIAIVNAEFSPDNKYFVASWALGSARLWDLTTGKILHTFVDEQQKGLMMRVAFSRDGKYVETGGTSQAILWDTISGNRDHVFPRKIEDGENGTQLVFLLDGKRFLTMGIDGACPLGYCLR